MDSVVGSLRTHRWRMPCAKAWSKHFLGHWFGLSGYPCSAHCFGSVSERYSPFLFYYSVCLYLCFTHHNPLCSRNNCSPALQDATLLGPTSFETLQLTSLTINSLQVCVFVWVPLLGNITTPWHLLYVGAIDYIHAGAQCKTWRWTTVSWSWLASVNRRSWRAQESGTAKEWAGITFFFYSAPIFFNSVMFIMPIYTNSYQIQITLDPELFYWLKVFHYTQLNWCSKTFMFFCYSS